MTATVTRKFYDLPSSSRPGLGPASSYVQRKANACRVQILSTETYGHVLRRVLRELHEEWLECQSPGWDGGNAPPIAHDVLVHAVLLVVGLPLDVPMPEVAGQPNGAIGLDWYRGANRLVWISVTADGAIHWIARAGDSRARGSDVLLDELPGELLNYIRRVMNE